MNRTSHQETKKYIDYLPEVKSYLGSLEHQDLWWTTVAMVGKINNENIDPQLLESIVDTQKEFQDLRNLMINSLVSRYLNQATSEITLNAQASIDIIIRNLFERTADVGFLATDDDLIEFLAHPKGAKSQEFIEHRIAEYIAKYSVYDDIVLLTPEGEVKAKYNHANSATFCRDVLIREALTTNEPYLEVYRSSDIFPNKSKSLIYAKRIEQVVGRTKRTVGILCLSFQFDEEMASIFDTLTKSQPGYKLMLADESASVIASSDKAAFPVGKRLTNIENQTAPSTNDKGFDYSTATQGYQGYSGLPWYSVAHADHKVAFSNGKMVMDLGVEIEKQSPIYLHDLEQMNLKVGTLLLIVILNGKITSLKRDIKSFMPVLDSFQEISFNIQSIFDDFIAHIHQVLVKTIQSKVEFSASLAVEIMDRNLYERANDCRWWALNSTFRHLLTEHDEQGALKSDQLEDLTKILNYINELYTVYTNILLYDRQGRVLAVSNSDENHLIGSLLPRPDDIRACMNLSDTQHYAVSEFHPSELYGGRSTYIYHAAVKHWDNLQKNVGGIALVFDSEPEFLAMLADSQPRFLNESINQSTMSLFTTRSGEVISSTEKTLPAGSKLSLPELVRTAKNGESGAVAWKMEGKSCILGYKVSEGYREYKTSDGYQNDVLSLVITAIQ